jgi:hypothetical protein
VHRKMREVEKLEVANGMSGQDGESRTEVEGASTWRSTKSRMRGAASVEVNNRNRRTRLIVEQSLETERHRTWTRGARRRKSKRAWRATVQQR